MCCKFRRPTKKILDSSKKAKYKYIIKLKILLDYYFVGGMPEAVATYVHSKRLRDVSEVHNSIIETYREDFPKYIARHRQQNTPYAQ